VPSREAPAPFRGVAVALVTLFDERGDLDAPATAELAAQLVALGVRAVVVAGSTGEAAALEPDERIALLDAVRAAVPNVPVIAGTGAPSARQATALTAAAADHGADAVLTLSPPGADDSRPYYDEVAKAAGSTPMLAYHFPAMSAPGIPVALLPDLPIVGCKDSSGDPDRLLGTLITYGNRIYVGASALLGMAGSLGCAGAILALANVDPEGCIAAFAGDPTAQLALAPTEPKTRRRFPADLKELLADRFGTSTVTRLS
jgi:4-hydroxy-tetrahydrodipicolinate synthase